VSINALGRPLTVRCLATVAAFAMLLTAATASAYEDKLPSGSGSYDDFVGLFEEFIDWRSSLRDDVTLPDYSTEAVAARIDRVQDFQRRIQDMAVVEWNRSQRANYLAALALLDEQEFLLRVYRPWSRDPGYYVDQIIRVAYTELPVSGSDRDTLLARLERARELAAMATRNLRDVPGDLADLALHNLTRADGVSHGQPYRAVQPEGVIGWYDDLLERAREQQPELVSDIEATQQAASDLNDWLTENRPSMTADAGIGEELLNWFLLHAKYMPYTADEIVAMAQEELDRTTAFMGLERHRFRDLPELEPARTREDYDERLEKIDADIRSWVVEEEFMTIPDDIPEDYREMRLPVPWMERPGGLNYWEAIQFRDPAPDHWHATIPGHGFDGWLRQRNITDPVRRHIRDGGRAEGFAMYLEEVPVQLGFYDVDRQRTRELIYNFQVFRAARTLGDVWLQRNEITTGEVVDYWMDMTPFLDEDVARVDAEIYLRRPPGYGLGYTVGKFQMYKLLADRMRQLGEDFVLKDFHDEFMAQGWLPIALIRYDMTGLDDEVRHFWERTPLSDILED